LQGGTATMQSTHATGILMLFSAGTFLYVATVHVLPEIIAQGADPAVAALITTYAAPCFYANEFSSGSSSSSGETYVALPTSAPQPSMGHSHAGGGGHFKLNELVALIVGAVAPVFLQMGHSH